MSFHEILYDKNNTPKQLRFEIDSWKGRMYVLMNQNTLLKNQLAVTATISTPLVNLDVIETILEKAIQIDETIRLMRNDIADFERILTTISFENATLLAGLNVRFSVFRQNLFTIDNLFETLKSSFDTDINS
jgi:hypothetical protein